MILIRLFSYHPRARQHLSHLVHPVELGPEGQHLPEGYPGYAFRHERADDAGRMGPGVQRRGALGGCWQEQDVGSLPPSPGSYGNHESGLPSKTGLR